MKTTYRLFQTLLVAVALVFSVSASAYEVHILTGKASESKALEDGRYAFAIERLELRLQRETASSDIQLTNLCTAFVVTGAFEKARDVCDRAVDADGDFVGTAFNSRGVLNALGGDLLAAIADFENANKKSNYPVARVNFGDLTPSMQRFGTPKSRFDNALQIAARNHEAANQLWASINEKSAEPLAAEVN